MLVAHAAEALLAISARSVRRWFLQFGGIGLVPFGLVDNSPIPIPGAMDVATIILSARQEQWWIYYALMATAGSIVGGYVTYHLARNSGKAALERRFASHHIDQFCRIFERWGFGAIAIPALLPPPVPMVPFLFAAGAMQYPAKKFLTALLAGRTVRYTILAYLGARYGRHIIALMAKNGHPVAVGITLVLIIAAMAIIYFWPGSRIEKWTLKLGGRSF